MCSYCMLFLLLSNRTKDRVPLLLVITADGRLHVFSFDPKESKDSKLLKSHKYVYMLVIVRGLLL